ncbi:MAG: hypothetical protein QN424_06995, partial [Nitrososphaeraceae archaeon]|nr:hypothetical protein [Nitrososphaeraceae archaeon]
RVSLRLISRPITLSEISYGLSGGTAKLSSYYYLVSCGLNVGPFSASFTNCALATTNIFLTFNTISLIA